MENRVPGKPGRVKLTPEGGGAPFYATLERADEPVKAGTPLSKETFLTDATAALFGLTAAAVPNDVLTRLANVAVWTRLATFETAGSRNWTAPDLFNSEDYEIGVWMCGGGGSGACASTAWTSSDWYIMIATGGASGRARAFKVKVTPGRVYPVVVGAGGAKVTFTTNSVKGNNGGATSFGGISVDGGGGGNYADKDREDYGTREAVAAIGAQCSAGLSTGFSPSGNSFPAVVYASNPFGGILMPYILGESSGSPIYGSDNFGMVGFPMECFDPFACKQMLGAGGGAIHDSDDNVGYLFPPGVDPTSGLGGGAASFTDGVSAKSATAPGCGGGAFALHKTGTHASVSNGAGAPGAVYIYARRLFT